MFMLVCFPFLRTALIYVARYHISLPCQKHAFGNDFRAASNIFSLILFCTLFLLTFLLDILLK